MGRVEGPTPVVADKLARWAVDFTLARAPAAAIDAAKQCLIDAIGVAMAGALQPVPVRIRQEVLPHYASGPCAVLGGPPRHGLGAAFANGVAAHALDYDDVSYTAMVHATAVVWPAAAAAAEVSGASGARFLEAFIAGVEAEYALACALGHDLFWRGWWTTGLLGAIGAAVAAAKAMRLGPAATAHAIRVAALQAGGPYALVGSAVKPYAAGRAAEAGLHAALFAAAGLTAPSDAFENDKGFTAMFGAGAFEPAALDALGERYLLIDPGVAFKRFPVCAGAQSAAEAALDLLAAAPDLALPDIVRIACEVTPDVGIYMPFMTPATVNEAQFCLPFVLAVTFAHRDLSVRHLRPDMLTDPVIRAAMALVAIEQSDALAAEAQGRTYYAQPARVTVTTRAGRTYRRLVPMPTGMPGRPLGLAAIERKFLACAADLIAEPAARAMLANLREVERLPAFATVFAGL
jgi:2-methylcitrate dehydratase PrpD